MDTPIDPSYAALLRDTPCIHCGYNLRGLAAVGRCPECGQAIAESLRGELLRFANPQWLRKVRKGIALHLWALALAIILGLMAGALVFALRLGQQTPQMIQWLPMLVAIWGTWLLTAREPRENLQEEGVSVRVLLRTLVCVTPIFQAVFVAQDMVPELLFTVVAVLSLFLSPLQYFLFLVFLRRFALRVPDEPLYRSSSRLLIFGAGFLVLFIANSIYSYFGITAGVQGGGAAGPPAGPQLFMGIVMAVMGIVMLTLFLWYVRLLSKYRKVLAAQVVLAEETLREAAEKDGARSVSPADECEFAS